MYLTAMVSMVLQLARFSSALLSYLAAIVAVAILIGGIVLTTEFVRPWLTSLGGDATLTVDGAILAGLFGVGIYLSGRFELRLAVRRVIVGVFLLLAALEGMVLVIVWLIPDMPRGITAPKMVVIPILFIIVAAVALRLTANQRRILALSGR